MNTQHTSENELFTRAGRAYRRRCEQNGHTMQTPNRAASTVDGDVVVLRNIRGEIARYRITGRGLRYVEPH